MTPGMVMSVEAYVGSRDGGEGVKLEEQVVITETVPNCWPTTRSIYRQGRPKTTRAGGLGHRLSIIDQS